MNEIVKVTWIDAQRLELGIVQEHELPDIHPIKGNIIGFKVHEDENRIIIAQESWEIGGCKYVHVIPKCSIIKITKLIEVKKLMQKIKRNKTSSRRIKR